MSHPCRVALRYLKLVTSFNFWSFMVIFALMSFAMLVMVLIFSVLTSIQYAVALSKSLSVRCGGSPLLSPIISVSSTNRYIWAFRDGYGCLMVMECFLRDLLRNKLNRMGDSKHP